MLNRGRLWLVTWSTLDGLLLSLHRGYKLPCMLREENPQGKIDSTTLRIEEENHCLQSRTVLRIFNKIVDLGTAVTNAYLDVCA